MSVKEKMLDVSKENVKGYITSIRKQDGDTMKVLIMGTKADQDDKHEDRGSFQIAYNGDTYFVDPRFDSGENADDNPSIDFHNTLLPNQNKNTAMENAGESALGESESKGAEPRGFIVEGKENNRGLYLKMHLGNSFGTYYSVWDRYLDSQDIHHIQLTDDYNLKVGESVISELNTFLPVEVNGHEILVKGKLSTCKLKIDIEQQIKIKDIKLNGKTLHQIYVTKYDADGSLEISMDFSDDKAVQ